MGMRKFGAGKLVGEVKESSSVEAKIQGKSEDEKPKEKKDVK